MRIIRDSDIKPDITNEKTMFGEKVNRFSYVLYLIYCIDYFVRISARVPEISSIRPTFTMVVILLIMMIVQVNRMKVRYTDGVSKSLFLLFLFMLFTLPLVHWPGSAIDNFPKFARAILFFVFTIAFVDSEKRLKLFLLVFVSCQLFRILEPLYLNLTEGYWGSSTWTGEGSVNRLSGAPVDTVNSNGLGFVIVTIIPYLHFFLPCRRFIYKFLYVVLITALLYVLVLTMSRGAFIALLSGGLVVLSMSKHKALLIFIGIGCCVALWSQMSEIHRERYLSIVSSEAKGSSTAQGRINGIFREFELGLYRPIVGHGLGTTQEAKMNRGYGQKASHNLYAELIIEAGFIGLFLFLRFMLKIYRNLKSALEQVDWKEQHNAIPDFYTSLTRTLLTVFVMYAVYSINYWGLSIYYWYLFSGICVVFNQLLHQKQSEAGIENIIACSEAG